MERFILFRTIGCVVSIVIGTLQLAGNAAAEKKVALVLGNNAYSQIRPLQKSRDDARGVADVLRGMQYKVTLEFDANASKLRALVDQFRAALKDADVGFFFYSGHGFQTSRSDQPHPVNHIVPTDFSAAHFDIATSTVALDSVIDALKQNARVGFIFMDACRNDPQLEAVSQDLQNGTRAVPISKGFAPVHLAPGTYTMLSRWTGNKPSGLLLAYSTDPGNLAWEGDTGQYSPFTGSLIRHLRTPGLSAIEIMGRVSVEVNQTTKGKQTPWNTFLFTAGMYKFVPEISGVRPTAVEVIKKAPPLSSSPSPSPSPSLGGGVGIGGF